MVNFLNQVQCYFCLTLSIVIFIIYNTWYYIHQVILFMKKKMDY